MNSTISRRFLDLTDQMNSVEESEKKVYSEMFGTRNYVDSEQFLEWTIKAKNLVIKACGEDSEHYKAFLDNEKARPYETNFDQFKRVKSVFIAAKEDFEGGHLMSFKTLVQSEVFENEIEQAEELLRNGYSTAAAVIAGTVLESGLRELCSRNEIEHGKIDKMNSDLAKSGIYNKLQQKRITALADIRNSAAHGRSDDFTAEEVQMMLRDVEHFIANKLDE